MEIKPANANGEAPGPRAENGKAQATYVYAILNTVRSPILVLNPDLSVKTSNEAFNTLFQVTGAQTENCYFYELGAGHWDVPGLRKRLTDVLTTNSNIRDLELSANFASLGDRTMLLNAQKLEQLSDEEPRILLSIEDVTVQRQIEAANQWMGAIVASSDDAIISKDLNGIIRSCNQGAARLFGYEVEELIGRPMRMLIPKDHQGEEDDILARIRRGERIEHFETIRQRKDGRLIEVSLVISPVKNATGQIIGASKIARDITDRRRSELRLEESYQREKAAREHAEAANRAKDDFLASLSHELRTPLNPVLLIASDLSENTDLPAEIKSHFEMIRKNIELEARLIDDLLDITRITHGKLLLHLRMMEVQTLLEEAIRNVRSEVDEKQIRLELKAGAARKQIYADEVRLQQVFWNVLKNAVKFTPRQGTITVELTSLENGLRITFTDTGIGMSAEETGRIFTAFAQGDHARGKSHRFGGLGLGLAIARKLVEMHGGKITAHSAGPGLGSTFAIELPTTKAGSMPPALDPGERNASVPTAPLTRHCILLVEDHDPTRQTMAHLLARRGYKVLQAGTVKEAKNISLQETVDFVVSDIGLPDGSGTDLMRYLQAKHGLKGIALTGYGMEEDIEKCIAAGFSTHLIKPVNIRALENALESLAGQ